MDYTAQQYRDPATGRTRWAVLHGLTRCWYFPTRYGQVAALDMARRLNRESRQDTVFDRDIFNDFVTSHGYGGATEEGYKIGRELMASGDDYATAAAEVTARGLTALKDKQ